VAATHSERVAEDTKERKKKAEREKDVAEATTHTSLVQVHSTRTTTLLSKTSPTLPVSARQIE
jgi:hypothetical protein